MYFLYTKIIQFYVFKWIAVFHSNFPVAEIIKQKNLTKKKKKPICEKMWWRRENNDLGKQNTIKPKVAIAKHTSNLHWVHFSYCFFFFFLEYRLLLQELAVEYALLDDELEIKKNKKSEIAKYTRVGQILLLKIRVCQGVLHLVRTAHRYYRWFKGVKPYLIITIQWQFS